jgi:hypothetical protein
MTQNEQHWIATVRDSINDYRAIQSAYFDGTESDARDYFYKTLRRYFGDNNQYQIIMQANPIVLQDP